MNRRRNFEIGLLIFLTLVMIGSSFPETQAFIPGAETIDLGPKEFRSFSYNMSKGDGLLAWISVQSGINVSLFILNSTQHSIFESGGTVSTKSAIMYLPADPNTFYGLIDPIPYDDKWYVYIYNHDLMNSAEVKLVIYADKEGPNIQSVLFDKRAPLFGDATLEIQFYDKADYLRQFDVYLDNDLIYSSNDTALFPGVVQSRNVNLPTYNYGNGNHTLRIVMTDQFGHTTSYSQSIMISNSWFDIPQNSEFVFIASGIFAFILVALVFAIKPARNRLYHPLRILILAFLVSIGFLLGILFPQPLLLSASLFALSFIALSLIADQGTVYIDSKIRPMVLQQIDPLDSHDTMDEAETYDLGIIEILGRSDILDKVRSNLRTGMSIIFGIGTAITIWFVNFGTTSSLSQIQLIFLVSAFLLAAIIASGIIVSFFPLTVQIGEEILDESLISELKGSTYRNGISRIVRMKLRIINAMRYTVGIGLGIFVVTNIFTFAALSIFNITHATRGLTLLIIAIISLLFVVYGLIRITAVLFGPIILEIQAIESFRDYLRNQIQRITSKIHGKNVVETYDE